MGTNMQPVGAGGRGGDRVERTQGPGSEVVESPLPAFHCPALRHVSLHRQGSWQRSPGHVPRKKQDGCVTCAWQPGIRCLKCVCPSSWDTTPHSHWGCSFTHSVHSELSPRRPFSLQAESPPLWGPGTASQMSSLKRLLRIVEGECICAHSQPRVEMAGQWEKVWTWGRAG